MELEFLFRRCLEISYTSVENGADYAIERIGAALYIYFESSNGCTDWKNNLDFPIKAHVRENDTAWFAHRGFLRVWKSIEGYIAPTIADPSVRKIITVGYSHGAALAALCHEYVWFYRPDLRHTIEGYGFGSPRVLWGICSKEIRKRWARFKVIRNIDDLVTHLPPALFGFSHVGELIEIGVRGKYSMTDAHRPENILAELRAYETGDKSFSKEKEQLKRSRVQSDF